MFGYQLESLNQNVVFLRYVLYHLAMIKTLQWDYNKCVKFSVIQFIHVHTRNNTFFKDNELTLQEIRMLSCHPACIPINTAIQFKIQTKIHIYGFSASSKLK